MTNKVEGQDTGRLDDINRLVLKRLMPLLVVVYVISFLDRTNIALARQTMSIDLGLSAAAYGLGAGLFFLTYSLAEIPSNLILQRVGARLWITRIMVTWGALSIGMAFVRGETSFYVMRLLLGLAEAGFYPGVMLYLTYWFGREKRAQATGYFLLGVSIANIVGGPLGGALLEMNGLFGLHGWQWLFVIEGIPALLLALVVWKSLPDGPESARWLSREDAQILQAQLEHERACLGNPHGVSAIRRCLGDKQLWLTILLYFCHQLAPYTVIFFLPSIIASSGKFTPIMIGSLAALPWVAAALGGLTIPRFANTPASSRHILFVALVIMGVGMFVAARATGAMGLLGVCLSTSMIFVVQPILFSIPPLRFSGITLAGSLALMNSCGLLGGFVGPTAMGLIEKTTGNATNGFLFVGAALLFAAFCSLRLRQSMKEASLESEDDPQPMAT